MSRIKELKEELDQLEMLQFISTALTEISAVKIQKIRNDFETNKTFYDELGEVYDVVKLIAAGESQKQEDGKSKEQSPGQTLSVAITSNMRFYGSLNSDVMRKFVEGVGKSTTDRMVMGQTGIDYMHSTGFNQTYERFLCKKDTPNDQEITKFLDLTAQYSRIFMYYPKFHSLVRQSVDVVDITHSPDKADAEKAKEMKAIFEPELSKLLEFFERQTRALLFRRAMLETDLSRTAARLMSMSAAEDRAKDEIKDKHNQLLIEKNSVANRQLLEAFGGVISCRNK